ncbi:hypothetical protein TURU_091268 [Turdus rufiventris]|nr:hypothetical protein TURU_091268 [Turdus rufiventris]
MPVLERFFPAAEPGRRRRTGEEPMPFPMGSLPGYQQGTLAWDLPEMIKMVKLVWKSKGELRGAKHRGVLESEDALGGPAEFSNSFAYQTNLIREQVQDLALGLVELVRTDPLLSPVKVPLDGILSFQHTEHTIELGGVGRLVEGALNPTVHVANKSVE